jgi:glutathione S-transferase
MKARIPPSDLPATMPTLEIIRSLDDNQHSYEPEFLEFQYVATRPLIERTMLIRHKERKFGRECIGEWTSHRQYLCTQFAELLKPIDSMLADSPFLLTDRSLFVDYNLYSVLGNYLFSGKTRLPNLKHLQRWYEVMDTINYSDLS